MSSIDYILIPPLISALLSGILVFFPVSRKTKTLSSWLICTISSLLSATLAIIFLPQAMTGRVQESVWGVWLELGPLKADVAYYIDAWSVMLAISSSFLTLIIVIFSWYYIGETRHAPRYYSLVSLFLFGMLLLVLSDSLLLTFLGWEITSLCSWGLISFYYYLPGKDGVKAGLSGQKAIVTTGIADIGFVVALFALAIQSYPTFSIFALTKSNVCPIIGTGLLLAAAGKSAQFPLHIWISSTDKIDIDAMQGPTTVSALIHAATMVNAGVYLVGRLILMTPPEFVKIAVLYLGAITSLYAGLCALGTRDIKRVLAYSTISQLGYMITALAVPGLGQFASLWHLLNHAMFKALLFLTAAVLIHTTHARRFDDLKGIINQSKLLLVSLSIGFLSLSGIPPFSGFFSKDLIIETLWEHDKTYRIGAIILIISAFLTSAYSARAFRLLWGAPKESKTVSLSVSARVSLISLVFLTLFSTLFYYPLVEWFDQIGQETPHSIFSLGSASLATLALVILGGVLGYFSPELAPFFPQVTKNLIQEGFYVDFLLSNVFSSTMEKSGNLASKVQTGAFYWNMIQFTLVAGIIGAITYALQIGGL